MNQTLELLLGRHYDGALAPEHRADMEKSGLAEATILEHYIRSVPASMIPRLLGFDPEGVRSALLFPFRSPAGGFLDHISMKVFPPLTDADGHVIKYLQPRGSPPRLYFSCLSLQAPNDDRALWFVEGQKKALAVGQLGLPAIGFCGIEGWHVRGSCDLLPDFEAIRLDRRIVELVPDGDVRTNPMVRQGIERFARALVRRGAKPRLVLLPRGMKVDDFLRDPSVTA